MAWSGEGSEAGSGSWSLVQHRVGERIALGVLAGDRVRALPSGWPTLMLELLSAWDSWQPDLRALDPASLDAVPGARLAAPITYPRKVLGAGANYYRHAVEMGTGRPDPTAPPFFFLKPPTTTVIGPGASVPVPRLSEAGLDWEVELAVVIGRECREVAAQHADQVIAGYTIANDLSARDRFSRSDAVAPPFAFDWLRHKGLDGSCPTGPGVVPAWQIPDPQDLRLRLSVDGRVKQDSSTADMVLGVRELVAAASWMVTLEPGDLILTGTPAGVGLPRREFLRDGDVVVAEIERIGRLENRIVER